MESYVEVGEVVKPPSTLTESLRRQAPAFVTIRNGTDLRGCIGTTEAKWPTLAHEIIMNAIAAATEDPRFLPIKADELAHLLYEVDILTPLEPIASEEELDPQRYGVLIEALGRRGLLLPALERVTTVAEQVAIAKRKAGIPEDSPVHLFRFEVERFRESRIE